MFSLSPDPIRDALQGQADHFAKLVGWANIAVAVGIAVEGVEIAHDVVTWGKRKRREIRDRIELKELAEICPGGELRQSTESHTDEPRWVKRLLRVGLIIVVLGVVAEWRCGAKLEDAHDAIHQHDLEKIAAADEKAGDAKDSAKQGRIDAGTAKDASDKAKASASGALTLAAGARKEADSFEADIKSAKQQAADAESHLADAMKRANTLTAQLERITTPRTLPDSPQLVSSLKPFRETEYMFTGVCGDTECINLLRDIDKVLGLAEWKRVKAPHRFPGLVLWGKREDDDGAGLDFEPGTKLSVDSVQGTAEEVDKLPLALLPQHVRAAVALNAALASNVSPTENTGRLVDVQTGTSTVVRISVGRKPLP